MGFLGNVFTSVVDAGLDMISSAWQNKLNKNAAYDAFKNQLYGSKELARFQAEELPSLQMAGYKRAGINPIVAYGGLGSSSMPSMSVSAARQEAPDFGAVFSRATARRELDLRESLVEQEQERADRLADAKIADMKEARRIQELGINNGGVVGLLKYMFGQDSGGKVRELVEKYAQPLFEKFLLPNSAKSNDKTGSPKTRTWQEFYQSFQQNKSLTPEQLRNKQARLNRYYLDEIERKLREKENKRNKKR